MEFTLKVRINAKRHHEFVERSEHYGLTLEQMASAMLEMDMSSNEHNDFEEIGYHLMFAAIELYPEREASLEPLRAAFVEYAAAGDSICDARKIATRGLMEIQEVHKGLVWLGSLPTRAEEREARKKAKTPHKSAPRKKK